MVRPKAAVNEEIDRHTTRLFKLLDGLVARTDKNAAAIERELSVHKNRVVEVIEANLIP